MQNTGRIKALLNKLQERLAAEKLHSIDVDVMMQYTRDVYEELLVLRNEFLGLSQPSSTESAMKETSGIVIEIPKQQRTAPVAQQQATENISHQDVSHHTSEKISGSIEDGEIFNAALKTAEAKFSEPVHTSVQAADTKKDIRKHIGINDKYLFMNELFHNNKFDYESVLDYINQSKSKHEVEAWLETEYITNGKWSKEDRTVELFYALVDKHFSNLR